jgi:hypothetical protein
MKLQIHADLEPRCVEFLRSKLAGFDTSKLEYVRLYDRTNKTATHGTWGRCTFPNRKKQLGYRIRCSVSISPPNFPYPVRWAIGTRRIDQTQWQWVWREDQFETREEAFVWIAGHEAFHWLRHSRQVPGQNYETQANRHGFLWLDEWRGPRLFSEKISLPVKPDAVAMIDGFFVSRRSAVRRLGARRRDRRRTKSCRLSRKFSARTALIPRVSRRVIRPASRRSIGERRHFISTTLPGRTSRQGRANPVLQELELRIRHVQAGGSSMGIDVGAAPMTPAVRFTGYSTEGIAKWLTAI